MQAISESRPPGPSGPVCPLHTASPSLLPPPPPPFLLLWADRATLMPVDHFTFKPAILCVIGRYLHGWLQQFLPTRSSLKAPESSKHVNYSVTMVTS